MRSKDVKTTKPISTISYNTPSYLRGRLEDLVSNKVLSSWHFIEHIPEDDEAGEKKHIHLYVVPSRLLLTDDLTEKLLEFDPWNPQKPKKCISWRLTKRFGDWYLYALHDKAYLASKGQSRRYHYSFDDVVTSDPDELLFQVREIDLTDTSPYSAIIEAQRNGLTFEQYVARGTIPIQQINNFRTAWCILLQEYTNRNGRNGHNVDEQTGEFYGEDS